MRYAPYKGGYKFKSKLAAYKEKRTINKYFPGAARVKKVGKKWAVIPTGK